MYILMILSPQVHVSTVLFMHIDCTVYMQHCFSVLLAGDSDNGSLLNIPLNMLSPADAVNSQCCDTFSDVSDSFMLHRA